MNCRTNYQRQEHNQEFGKVWVDDLGQSRRHIFSARNREENNYYPFGLKHKGYNNVVNGTDHPYGFGGKEEQNELGLNWIDIAARNYDPALGRWMNLDPLAEQMRRHSPYNHAFDNPVYFIDPDGMEPFGFEEIGDDEGEDSPPPDYDEEFKKMHDMITNWFLNLFSSSENDDDEDDDEDDENQVHYYYDEDDGLIIWADNTKGGFTQGRKGSSSHSIHYSEIVILIGAGGAQTGRLLPILLRNFLGGYQSAKNIEQLIDSGEINDMPITRNTLKDTDNFIIMVYASNSSFKDNVIWVSGQQTQQQADSIQKIAQPELEGREWGGMTGRAFYRDSVIVIKRKTN